MLLHSRYNDVIKSEMASQITGISIAFSVVCSDADNRKLPSSATLAFVNSLHKGPMMRKTFPFDEVIMTKLSLGVKIIMSFKQIDHFHRGAFLISQW